MFYKNVGIFPGGVSDCEELVGVSHRRRWGWFYGIYITKSIVSFFIFLPEEEGVLKVDGVSGQRNWKDDLADFCPKAFLELLI